MTLAWLKKLSAALAALTVAVFGLWFWFTASFAYSSGERAGYIQKFSRRGWLVKTWEGDLAMVSLPGAVPEIFRFSVRKPEAVEKIRANMGRRVALRYDEHRHIPLPVFGETSYFATDVRPVDDAAPPSSGRSIPSITPP